MRYMLMFLISAGVLMSEVPRFPPDSVVTKKLKFPWKGHMWVKFNNFTGNNYFDSSLVVVDTVNQYVYMKAYRIAVPPEEKGHVIPGGTGEFHASAFRLDGSLGPIGTYKFVMNVPEFSFVPNYFTQSIMGPVLYTFYIPLPSRAYEYDAPEIYGSTTDTLGHYNMYIDSLYWEIDTIIDTTWVIDTPPNTKPAHMVVDTIIERILKSIRLNEYHYTFDWGFEDAYAWGNGITTCWFSFFGDSIIFSVERWVRESDGGRWHIERSMVITDTTFFPNMGLTPEFYLWWGGRNLDPDQWIGPDTLLVEVRDFSYSSTPVDPRKGTYYIPPPPPPRDDNTLTSGYRRLNDIIKAKVRGKMIYLEAKEPTKVDLNIYNLSGRKEKSMSVLVDKFAVIDVEKNGLSTSGVYFATVKAQECNGLIKLVFVK